MILTERRTAVRAVRCPGCERIIRRGEDHLAHHASPDHDGIGTAAWSTVLECLTCAARNGHTGDPATPEQPLTTGGIA